MRPGTSTHAIGLILIIEFQCALAIHRDELRLVSWRKTRGHSHQGQKTHYITPDNIRDTANAGQICE